MNHAILMIDPSNKSIEEVTLPENRQGALYAAFPYHDGQARTFEKDDNGSIITSNPFGRVDGSGLRDGVFWFNHRHLGWLPIFGKAYVFGSFEQETLEAQDNKDDLPIRSPNVSKEELQNMISWSTPAGQNEPSMMEMPYKEVREMADDWASFIYGPALEIAKMLG